MNAISVRLRPLLMPLTGVFTLLALSAQSQQPATPPTPATSSTSSLADILKSHNAHRLHILYVHGIGDDGPSDRDSFYLRRGMCETLACDRAHRDGEEIQGPVFANSGHFAAGSTPPSLTFFDQKIFPANARGQKMWDASAPFFRRYKLTPSEGQSVYVDEIDWWPLVFAVKCRYMVAEDARLIGVDKPKKSTPQKPKTSPISDCTQPEVPDPSGHYPSYPFISTEEETNLLSLAHQGAHFNREVKSGLMDWGFTDAVLSLGPMRQLLLEGLQQVIQLAVQLPADPTLDASQAQEFVIVTHSLGSYLIFAALDSPPQTPSSSAASDFNYVLEHTNRVYFFANQLRLIEMANLDPTGSGLAQHLTAWVNARKQLSPQELLNEPRAQIVAWNDPSDLLTWEVPSICGIVVENHTVNNSFDWFGIIESPTKAHDYYGLNKKVIHDMLHSEEKPVEPQPCPNAASITAPAATTQ